MAHKEIDIAALGRLIFCGTFFAVGILAVVLCLDAGAWFAGLVVLALTARMAFGLLTETVTLERPAQWLLERRSPRQG